MRTSAWALGGFILGFVIVVIAQLEVVRNFGASPALDDPRPEYRAEAVRRLERDGNTSVLIKMLSDTNPDVRLLVAEKLGGAGHNGAGRALALVQLLADDHQPVRREAAWSMGIIGVAAWPAFEQALQDPNPQVRLEALWGLYKPCSFKVEYWPGRHRSITLPVVEKLLQDPDSEVRKMADETVRQIKRPAGPYGKM